MSIPPISPMQAVQIGLAAKAAGTVAVTAFSDLLRSAADFLGGEQSATPTVGQASGPSTNGSRNDVGILQGQIESLLKSFGSHLKDLIAGNGIALPDSGLTVTQSPTGLGVLENHPEKSRIEDVLNGSGTLTEMFRAIIARQQLLQSALPSSATPAQQIHVAA